jgi:GT2 family glycosyltransferase
VNAILTLCHNNLHLTQQAIWHAMRQDVPVEVFAIDNGSTDGTVEWLRSCKWLLYNCPENRGVSAGWNQGLKMLFDWADADSVLVIGNDTRLAPWTMRLLLSYNLSFVTGVAVDEISQIEQTMPPQLPLEPHPDFSCFLIRRDIWEAVGPFDERMKHYASDCDFHIRAHRKGINLYKACVPFYHERSSTLRLASPEERMEIQEQANKDRAVFQSMYNCLPGQKEYYDLFRAVETQ